MDNRERQAKLRARRAETRKRLDKKAAVKGWKRIEGYVYVAPKPGEAEDDNPFLIARAMLFSLDGKLIAEWDGRDLV